MSNIRDRTVLPDHLVINPVLREYVIFGLSPEGWSKMWWNVLARSQSEALARAKERFGEWDFTISVK